MSETITHKRFQVLDVNISAVDPDKAFAIIDDIIQSRRQTYVCVAPVSTIISCQEDQSYREVVNRADMVTPDGMPLVWLAKLMGHREVKRTYGPDLMLEVCAKGEEKGYRHYFYGGTEETCKKLEETLRKKFPNLNIVGVYAPPFRELSPEENRQVTARINAANPDVLWVGLGSPKQDFWMARNRDILDVPVMVGVGAAFDFHAGVKRQAPKWMQRSGLEWFFRLCCEPRRLWRRYLIGNTKFICLVTKNLITKHHV